MISPEEPPRLETSWRKKRRISGKPQEELMRLEAFWIRKIRISGKSQGELQGHSPPEDGKRVLQVRPQRNL
jgi:hypothetical protein